MFHLKKKFLIYNKTLLKEKKDMNDNNDDTIPPFLISVRCLLTIMAFFGYCLQYMLKINMGIVCIHLITRSLDLNIFL